MRCVSRQLQHSAASCLLRADAAKIITGFNTGGIRARHALMRETLPQLPACRVQPFRPGPTPNHSSQPTRRYSRPRCRRDFCARFRVKRQAAPGRLSLALAWESCTLKTQFLFCQRECGVYHALMRAKLLPVSAIAGFKFISADAVHYSPAPASTGFLFATR